MRTMAPPPKSSIFRAKALTFSAMWILPSISCRWVITICGWDEEIWMDTGSGEAVYGGNDKLSDLFNASEVIDPKRPTDPALYAL